MGTALAVSACATAPIVWPETRIVIVEYADTRRQGDAARRIQHWAVQHT